MLDDLFDYLWDLLPDNCRHPQCKRQGVLGNENVINGVLLCDQCSAYHINVNVSGTVDWNGDYVISGNVECYWPLEKELENDE